MSHSRCHTRESLLSFLQEHGVACETYEHPVVMTIEEQSRHVGHLDGGLSKNLFLKDKKNRLYVVSALTTTQVDLKALSVRLGLGKGGVRMAPAESLQTILQVPLGCVTPFALINESARSVSLLLDIGFQKQSRIFFHPLANDASTALTAESLDVFLKAIGREPSYVDLEAAVVVGKDQPPDLAYLVPKEANKEVTALEGSLRLKAMDFDPQPKNRRHDVAASMEEGKKQRARASLCMALLTLQYGVQPLISKRFNGKSVIATSAVLTCELVKCAAALFFMARDGTLWRLSKEWSFADSLKASALPAAIYALQNTLLQLSYRNLDSLTFSLLNQTKLVFTAMFMFLFLGSRQTRQQIGALVMLLIAAMLLSFGKTAPDQRSTKFEWESMLWLGVIPIISASVLSGLASTLCQWAAQVKRRSSYLMTVEMSTYGSLVLLTSMWLSPDGVSIQKLGFFHGWTTLTFIPIILNAFGGILVGLVTQYSGGVKKGFVIVSALLVTALLEVVVEGKSPSSYAIAALPLVVSSTIIHQNYPHTAKLKTA